MGIFVCAQNLSLPVMRIRGPSPSRTEVIGPAGQIPGAGLRRPSRTPKLGRRYLAVRRGLCARNSRPFLGDGVTANSPRPSSFNLRSPCAETDLGTVRRSVGEENRMFALTPDATAKPQTVMMCHSSGWVSKTVSAFRPPWLSALLRSVLEPAGSASRGGPVDIDRVTVVKGCSRHSHVMLQQPPWQLRRIKNRLPPMPSV